MDREFKMVIHGQRLTTHLSREFSWESLSGNAQWAYIFCNFLTVISGILGFMSCLCTCVAQAD